MALKDLRDKLQLSDSLRFDNLRGERMQEVASKRKDVAGLSLYDDEYQEALQLKDRHKGQESALKKYKNEYAANMSKANAEANQLLAKVKKESFGDIIPIRVVDPSGNNIEATYHLPKQVAENIAKEKGLYSTWVDGGKAFNVSVRVEGGRIRGQEIHDALREAEQDIRRNDPTKDVQRQIDSQRGIAEREYRQNVELAQKSIDQTRSSYTNWITRKQQEFRQGAASNRKGIASLVNSGALILKPTVKA